MMPLRMNHQDPKTHGERANEFVPDRFLEDMGMADTSHGYTADGTFMGKTGPSIKSLRPFGGGVTLCPGRFFAINETLAFIAVALRRFDIQLVEGQKEAKPLTTTFSQAGTFPPDRDVSIRVRLRK
jgi:cytochrome P450